MALSLTIGATNQTNYIRAQSMTMKLNTLDLLLVDPAVTPALGDAVTMTGPAWSGTVASVGKSDPVDKVGHVFVTISATNTTEATASAGPFNLSDNPNNTTTFGYSGLSVKTTYNTDATTSTEGSCVIHREGLWPGMTFQLTSTNQGYSATDFSVTNVTVSWPTKDHPVYAIDFGDPIVTMSVWNNQNASDFILPIDETKITDGAVTTPKIATNAITAETIDTGAITADKLAAEIILASLIKTADTGARVELDDQGFRSYDASENLLVKIPTDDQPVYVSGEIQASQLTVTGNAELRGSGNKLASSSALTLEFSIADPLVSPTISQAIKHKTAQSTTAGLVYDSAGGAGGATAVYWTATDTYLYELLASDGTINRSKSLSGIYSASLSVAVLGSYVYLLGFNGVTRTVTRWNKSDFPTGLRTTYGAVSFPIASPRYPVISGDGTYLYIADTAATTGYVSWNVYDNAMVKQGSTVATGVAPGGASYEPGGMYTGNGDFGAWRLLLVGWNGTPNSVFAFDSAGARQTASEWSREGGDADGITYDGNYFYILKAGYGYFTQWSKNTTNGVYYIGYTWYDSVGTTHETEISPRATLTLGKRYFLTVTTPNLPGGGAADEPDNRRIYMIQNGSDPGSTGFKLQTTTTSATTEFDNYDSGGAADPASNNFPTGTASYIKSSASDWVLKGNGFINYTGTSFPASPATNDHYYRSDLGLDFFYNGTRWLSSQLFHVELSIFNAAAWPPSISATTAAYRRGVAPMMNGGSDIWLENWVCSFYVAAGGSALSGTHYWTGTLQKGQDGTNNTLDAATTITVNSGASATVRRSTASIGALMNNGTVHDWLQIDWTKSNTPGAMQSFDEITYRIVAT